MSKKVRKTIEYINDFFKKSNYLLLSKTYLNANSKLYIKCPNGHYFWMRYSCFQQGKRCKACSIINKRLNIEEVKDFFKKEQYVLLSEYYSGSRIKLHTVCPNGHDYFVKYNDFQQGNRCNKCNDILNKYTIEEVTDIFKKDGYVLISKKYKNAVSNLKTICPNGHKYSVRLGNFIYGYRCRKCSLIKRKQTCLEKYGVESPLQKLEIAIKQAKSSNNSTIKFHWKTNEELVCQGSYEAKTVDYLNANKINFEWQPKTFTMPNGKTYRPDLYLIDQDVWVEIKGWMRKDAQEKWDWFKTQFPTAELWDRNKLKEIGIKVR